MKLLLLLLLPLLFLQADSDPAAEAYKAWELQHRDSDFKAREQSLFEVSAVWVAKWPDSKKAWNWRRESLVGTQNHSPELWKQVDENLIRLSPPHTFASLAAYDWVANGINVKAGEALIASEIEWLDARSRPALPPQPSLGDLIEEAYFGSKVFGPLCTLASAQIQMKEFDQARRTIKRIRTWLDGDFKLHFDQDPLATFPDYEAKDYILSAKLAQAEGRNLDALAFWQKVITNPYFHREYAFAKEEHELWLQAGGTEEGWAAFSRVPPLPAGVPAGDRGMPFLMWVTLDYKLPNLNLPGLGSRAWTNGDFEGKTTMVYLWASWCGPCRPHLPGIQAIYDKTKNRQDMQIVTLSVDEDQEKLAAFMKDKGYTFPVMLGKDYTKQLIPEHMMLGQTWILDKTGSIRLDRLYSAGGSPEAEADEAIYKLNQAAKR
jgi:thiol-disulfide isomerase/thioredoxin